MDPGKIQRRCLKEDLWIMFLFVSKEQQEEIFLFFPFSEGREGDGK